MQAAKYILLGTELYKRGISTLMLKCLDENQAGYVIRKIHEGIWGTYSGERTMAAKILRARYFWLTLSKDCDIFVKKCIPCQQHGPHIHQHADTIHPITSPWPFTIWGMDLLRPFPLAKGQYNGLQFTDRRFNEFLEGLQIKHKVTSAEHP
ncbi:uncharacterized protein LOC113870068 [Abrus precatorius]|uniref:Uncharacterized protein LOC113870068 n=1 Tax=Abrus precatorius TaxID=3816 RepID=A0A8B8M3D5_ABRPR|nr:uncharacterized protein LOC113870068 [Abrus precatorius]